MSVKALAYAQIAAEAIPGVTGSYKSWTGFLSTMARLYKYPYYDQLLIHIQRPDATACASYELWNKTMHRYVRRGSKGIALLDTSGDMPRLHYVFDISDTGTMPHSLTPIPWMLTPENQPRVAEALSSAFGFPEGGDLAEQIKVIAADLAADFWQNNSKDMIDSVDGSFLSGYAEASLSKAYYQAVVSSTAWVTMARCGLNPEDVFRAEDFADVASWNTPRAAAIIGSAISNGSEQMLRQVERTIRGLEAEQNRQAETERSSDHERTDLHPERGLSNPEHHPERGGAEAPGQVRADAAAIPEGASASVVERPAPGGKADTAPAGDRRDSAPAPGSADGTAGAGGGLDGENESQRPDELGTADERLESSGGGSHSLGADLQLRDITAEADISPQEEQLSMFAPEIQQIQTILEAESANAPFAFSVPQEAVDQILRLGSNTEQHRMVIAMDFVKQRSQEQIADHLREIYHGGNGLIIKGKKYAVWYDTEGLRIAAGTSARYANMAQILSWEDAARRIGDLMDAGQFATPLEIAEAPAYERRQAAETLLYLWQNLSNGAATQGFLPSLNNLKGNNFPEETALLSERLADMDFCETVDDELIAFRNALQRDRSLLRFRHPTVENTLTRTEELMLPHLDYTSNLEKIPEAGAFITEDEINDCVARGSDVEASKKRIWEYWQQHHTTKEQADFLKNEYGIGGRSHALSRSDHSDEGHDSKGMHLKKRGCADVHLTWSQAAKRMNELIRRDRFLTQEQKAELQTIQEDSQEPAAMPQEEPDEEIHPGYIRERLAEYGIVNGEVVDPEKLSQSPFIQQVEAAATAIEAGEQEQALDTDQPAVQDAEFPYQVGDTVTLEDGTPFIIEKVSPLGVELRDPSLAYPVLRAESRESFARLMEQYPQPQKQPEVTSKTVAVYPAEQNSLPYDVVVERMVTAPEKEHIKQPPARNFRITDDHLGEGGPKAKYAYNVAAIRTLQRIEAEGRTATPEEQEILSRYVGWGGVPDAFDGSKPEWAKEYAELKELLAPQEYEAARASTLNSHYTSPTVIRAIYETIGRMGFTSGNILEPSMGVGNFFGMLPEEMSASRLYGVELDPITGRIAQQLYPKAEITVEGFETTNRKDFFDLAVGNVPFGQYQVNDRAYNKLGFSIHNYFFAKALDQVRPGGVIAFITSRYTMDAQNPSARRYIAQRAELLGAVRLPNNAFKANAGTEVVSDVLFLQKRDHPIDIDPDWVHLGVTPEGYAINAYFADHPEMILGRLREESTQYVRQTFTVEPIEGANLAVQLASAMQSIRGTYQAAELPDLGEGQPSQDAIPADPDVKNYSYTVVEGEVYYRENSVMVRPTLNQTAKERIKGLVALRNCTNDLIQAQMDEAGDDAIHAHQQRLNSLYDDFTAQFGLISSRPNALAFQDDSSYYLLCSLEVLDGKGNLQRKADMFFKRTIRQHHAVEHVDTAAEALAVSIGERARVDLPYMAQLTGKEEKQIADELKGVIFCLPGTKAQYVTADEYLSGNVRQKLREAKLAAQLDTSFQINVEALERAQPKDLEASEIDVRLGATWVDKAYIQQFMEELLQPPLHLRRLIQVQFSPYSAEWRISGKDAISSSNIAAYTTYGTGYANAYHILEDTLNLRDVRIYDTVEDKDGKPKRVLNQKATTLAQQKQQAIKDAFKAWIWKNPERRHALVAVYNERFNAVRPRTYDGSHIVFGGMNPDISLREHQRNAIAHVLYGGNTLLAHVVGSGKTFEMVAACMESKRLGLSQKAMIVVPNHLTEQWGSEFLRLYPSANILVTTKKDFEKANRKKFCARIATGDYDAIIIGHSQFERIPISKERQERLLNEQINEITAGIEELQHSHGERFSIKELERSRKLLTTRLTKLQAEDKKDDVITFEQLGVDRLLVDEAHLFKNLFLTTKMRNVAGLSTSEAQKSSDMFAKCRYLDEITGGRGVVFATGTPVSNSMTELFTMQRYLQYDTLRRNNMVHFDCWASTFGETTTAIELAPEGTGYRARTRFSRFFNLPELMTMFREVADIKTADQLHLTTPTAHYETIAVKPTAEQEALVQALSERASKIHGGAVDASVDNMLKVTTDGRKLGLDQRLLNPLLPDDPGSKVNVCVHNIHRIWEENSEQRLTQLVFCDISTPKGAGKDGVPTEFSVYDDVRAKLIGLGIPKEEIAFIHDADTETKKKELFAKVRAGQVRVLMGSTQKMGAGTNCQDRLIALHDLDCPWRPGDLEQRAGRIVRQGNQNQDVYIYRYVTEKSFDSYLWQTVENKQRFISQVMTSKSPVRSCEDMDETALSYAEIKALCAGDERIKEKMSLDVEVARLRMLKADHESRRFYLEDQLLKSFPAQVTEEKASIAGFEKDMATLKAHPLPEKDFVGMEASGQIISDKEEAGKAILAACTQAVKGDAIQVGSYRGFDVRVSYDAFKNHFYIQLQGAMHHTTEAGNDARGNILRMDNLLEGMPDRLEAVQQRLDNLTQQIEAAKVEVAKPFAQEEELKAKSARLSELDAALNLDGNNSNKEEQEKTEQEERSSRPSVRELLKVPYKHGETQKNQQELEER